MYTESTVSFTDSMHALGCPYHVSPARPAPPILRALATNVQTVAMADGCVLKALRSRAKSLNLDNSHLEALSPLLGKLDFLHSLSAKNNRLQGLPPELSKLSRVSSRCYTL